ncbi:Met-10+ like-protein-domain-containing protein [Pilobolus umbonatus]|nr:Met-10+ like-protein-domain-containing protein [Pilobolus umbonatus]
MSLLTPPIRRGMSVLNRDEFKKVIQVMAIRVPSKKVGQFMKSLSNDLLNQPRMRNVVNDPDSKETKLVLLSTDIHSLDQLPKDHLSIIETDGLGLVHHVITLDYDYWTAEQIFHSVMPENATDIPSSFTQIGHIAHMNLREEYHPWKKLIGEVILDKNKNITTVVNKISSIDTTYRFFKMEVLAGDDNMIAEVKESGCKFKFDFSKVYWNSRLSTEHDRLIQLFKPNQYVCDVFAGVGPFAIPAAKKGTTVYANDLNPSSYEWMKENIRINKVNRGIYPYNMDGREFIHKAVQDLQATSNEWKTFDHFIMNLPAMAIEFLDSFRGLYYNQRHLYKQQSLPMIHCHCFTKSPNARDDIFKRVENIIGAKVDNTRTSLHLVRNVAPNKDMYCISFPLNSEVAFMAPNNDKRKRDEEITVNESQKQVRTE